MSPSETRTLPDRSSIDGGGDGEAARGELLLLLPPPPPPRLRASPWALEGGGWSSTEPGATKSAANAGETKSEEQRRTAAAAVARSEEEVEEGIVGGEERTITRAPGRLACACTPAIRLTLLFSRLCVLRAQLERVATRNEDEAQCSSIEECRGHLSLDLFFQF